jgi:TDG/mug DNA glycosylase family protein
VSEQPIDTERRLPEIVRHGLRAVLVGTSGRCGSPHRSHYYDGPGNHFWRLLRDGGLTPVLLGPSDEDSLPHYGLGLTDLVWRNGERDVVGLEATIATFGPSVVAFTSKTAATEYARGAQQRLPRDYGPLSWTVAGRPAFVLPGPSGANNAMPVPLRAALWRDLGDFIETLG